MSLRHQRKSTVLDKLNELDPVVRAAILATGGAGLGILAGAVLGKRTGAEVGGVLGAAAGVGLSTHIPNHEWTHDLILSLNRWKNNNPATKVTHAIQNMI